MGTDGVHIGHGPDHPNPTTISGEALGAFIGQMSAWRATLDKLTRHGDRRVIEAIIRHRLSADDLSDQAHLQARIGAILGDLRERFPNTPWPAPQIDEDPEEFLFDIIFTSRLQGSRTITRIDRALLESAQYGRLLEAQGRFEELLAAGAAQLWVRGTDSPDGLTSVEDALDKIIALGKKGQTIQRYKGLGELNPEQRGETTMDPTTRTLLQVRIDDAVEADELFTVLMGDEVEPRRNFIFKNALNVRNLDV